MSEFILSADMSLPIPVVGVAPGPNYATDVNNCLTLIDSHDHSFGKGTQVTPAGLNISTDLNIQQNNLTNIRTSRFFQQTVPIVASPPDIDCLYDTLGDLYFNDGFGNQVRITQNGGVAGSPGSIANLTSPASASYSAGTETFIWQSDVNTAANMDMGSIILRDITANSFGVTINPPAALAADYSLTLPSSLPGSTSILTVDASGNIAAPGVYPLTTPSLADGAVTLPKMAAPNIVISGSSGTFSQTDDGNNHDITNLNASITVTGKPVNVSFQQDGTSVGGTNAAYINLTTSVTNFLLLRDNTVIVATYDLQQPTSSTKTTPAILNFIDTTATAGVHTYKVQVRGTVSVFYTIMIVREL